jgi:hypothetical protein
MNTAPNKKKSNDKIDDMAVLLMAMSVIIGDQESQKRSFWEDMS